MIKKGIVLYPMIDKKTKKQRICVRYYHSGKSRDCYVDINETIATGKLRKLINFYLFEKDIDDILHTNPTRSNK